MVQTPTTHKRFLALLLLAMVAVVYLPSTRNSFVWDDDYYITHNMTLSGVSGLRRIWLEPGATPQYYPLVFTSFWLEYHLFGLNPAVFHTTNILLHAANALLAWLVLSRLRIPWAWVAAAIFAIHPVNVESVAWVSERKNVLSGFFVLLSLLFLIDALIPSGRETRTGKRLLKPWLPGVAAFLFFVPALLSKSVTSMMPVVFLLLAWWKTPETWFRKALALAPFFIAGGAAGLHTVVMEKAHVGAHGVEWYFSMADRILIATRALWFYAGKLAFPVNMVFIYPRWEIDASAPLQYLFPLATLALLAWLWTARLRIGRGPLTGVAIFVVTLFPALGFINYYPMRYSFVADHFQYLAGIAMIALATAGGHVILSAGGSHRNRKTAWALCAGLLLLLGVRTFQEQAKYENFRTLWRDTLIKNPECWMAHNNLGTLLSKIGEYERATTHFQESLRIYPMNIMARLNLEAMSGKHDPTTSAQLLYTNSAARPV
ncbi:MAG: tetratricopeptide repeat protein [Thermodesulfobacteriota bacterium]